MRNGYFSIRSLASRAVQEHTPRVWQAHAFCLVATGAEFCRFRGK